VGSHSPRKTKPFGADSCENEIRAKRSPSPLPSPPRTPRRGGSRHSSRDFHALCRGMLTLPTTLEGDISEPGTDQFGQIFDRDRAVIQQGFVIAAQVEAVAQLPFQLLAQPIVSHAPDKIGAQLNRALLGADDFQPG